MTNPIQRKLDVKYEPGLALTICELVASGKTVVEISETDGMPSRTTIYRWLSVYPKFFDAFERAKEISAQSFEEEALTMARELRGANDFTGTKVQAYNVAMQQLRWSASRRDKARYGQQVQASTSVPITINTTLNLGQEGMGAATDIQQSVYTVTATVGPAEVEGDDDMTVESVREGAGEVLDLEPEPGDNEARAFGLPDEEHQQLHNPPNGRPPKTRRRKGHKTAGAAKRTAGIYARAGRADAPSEE